MPSSAPGSSPPAEKRNFSGMSTPSNNNNNSSSNSNTNKPANGNSHFQTKLKNFFRINSLASDKDSAKPEGKGFRQSKFFHVGRNRSVTVASEGNQLDDPISPTAHANPYFKHQGLPNIRHHNDESAPSSPTDGDSPISNYNAASGANDQAIMAGKQALARKLRRVASAPNAQGLLASGEANGDKPATAAGENGFNPSASSSSVVSEGKRSSNIAGEEAGDLQQPDTPLAFRRTYSSNSIKVRNVEVGPSSFEKIKLIGKGDVGKVYLVKEKKSSRLYAMKGMRFCGAFRNAHN